MLCPVCKTVELKMTERQGIEIDYCPTCRGVWLDRGELDKLIERALSYGGTAAPSPAPAPTPAPAPQASYAPPPPSRPAYDSDRRERYDDDDDDYRRRGYSSERRYDDDDYHKGKSKKKSFLGEVFDIF